jgi:Cd2+/Zn2+-exporting ATPase
MTDTQTPLQFKIHGMDCAEEVAILKREIGPLVGGESQLTFDVLNAKMGVLPSATVVTQDEVVRAVGKTGMRAEPWRAAKTGEAAAALSESFWERRAKAILTSASGAGVLVGLFIHVFTSGWGGAFGSEGLGATEQVPTAARIFYVIGILAGTWQVLPKALNALKRLRPDMNLLMVVAIIGAIALGDWFEAATVSFLFAVSLFLESWSVGRARRAVASLLALAPTIVRVKRAGAIEELPPDAVDVGSEFVVRPGEKVALDGTVLTGESGVDQSPITGESVPVPKASGDVVYAGTINGDGVLEVRSTKRAEDTTLAQIVRLVEGAQSRRAPSEQWVEKFARVYTPVVMVLAVLVATLPPLVLGGTFAEWVYRALVLLVIACPCALVISTPVSVVAALAAAARNGILIKGGAFIEAPARIRAVALDKTGTLTKGKPSVVEIVPMNGHDERELLERAAALESHSGHPLAAAIVAHAQAKGVSFTPATDVQNLQGKGVTAQFDGKPYWLGSHRYLEERGQETAELHERLEQMTAAGQTVVVIGNHEHVCGLIALADAVRAESREAVAAMKRLGVEHVVMLTGDNRGTARSIGDATGVDEVRSELLPADKVTAIEELVHKYGAVAMIGDGVNDAPALGRATIGIAMGAAGSDAAIETADVALMSDDLGKLPWLIAHARRTLGIIRQNIIFALGVKAIFAVLTLTGHASMWAAIAADAGASLLVIANGLRLLRIGSSTTDLGR